MGTTFTPTDPKLIVVGQVVMKKGSANKPHGTRTKYVSDKCRCEPCREANSDYQRKQGGRTVPPYVDAQAARDVTDQRAEYAEEARLEQLRTPRAKYRSSPELPAPPGPTPWMTDAACRFPETPTWLFFGAELDAETTAQAKIVCECCHVRAKCLDYAIEVSAVGVWGGLSTAERDLERRRRLGRAL